MRLTEIHGAAAPLPIENLDTDQIMPKQFLRIIDKAGLKEGLLYDLRFDAQGEPRSDCVLNLAEYRDARILIGGSNFGCGSSREHAVWGLQQAGFEAVIAPSFAEIFYSNAMNNRLLLVQLERDEIDLLLHDAATQPAAPLHIDVERQTVTSATGRAFAFPLGARHKQMVVEGMDTIDLTLASLHDIEAFERDHFTRHSWAAVL
ncbi:3-isopropylmalate/(R)-2-methylmalate dehydratase small subunit [Paraburkholderia sp. BL6665CI2N2]|uniref:3-isopropylmalate dehydratase small subunit n=1 Tax=Paraburkholderia sp. BL6665CI2N2 TaxID=1938806 RepID=UPI001065EE81|nr:3-isopropylmalate dehydratase small subunit [Paraburkholderia sp. BL6665CI2N2]TDY23549.1 3-isopropylmalate/(R)-2-methylmalate dehydratase small subunit [Paraburkholderia sp. BL6665CI2N2]